MSSIQMVNSIVEWERRIDFEQTRRTYHSSNPYGNYLTEAQTPSKQNKSLIDQVLGFGKKQQPVIKKHKDPQPC